MNEFTVTDGDEWVSGRGACPDCGRDVAIYNSATLFPSGKASRHNAPAGVIPGPYIVRETR